MNAKTLLRGEKKATLLIVDDTPENLMLLGELLQPDYRVRVANSGQNALRIAASDPKPDLILLDVMMPDMNGFEVLSCLQVDQRTQDIPVIFVTALDAVVNEQWGLELGAVDYITKPLRPAIVQARIHTQLELKRARDWLRDQNVYLEAEITRRMAENQLIQDISIHALARLAEIRDPETGNHLRRTRDYVRKLALLLRDHPRFGSFLTDHTIQLLAKSAPLHDIGKVGIPDHILLKPGKLNPQEWAIMKTHAQLGSEAIEQAEHDAEQSVDFLKLAKDIAHYHHERWDGSGYPEKLSGESIPIAARLMAIADVYDALITRRVYKPPMPYNQAKAILAGESGRHFDPVITDYFLANYNDFCVIAERYSDSEEALNTKLSLVQGRSWS